MKMIIRSVVVLLALALAPAALAQTKPDPTKIPALEPFLNQEGKAYFMGQEAGLNGWFIIMSANRVQIAYTSLDNQNVIIGAIFAADGANITERQMVATREREPEVNKLFTNTVEQAKANMVKASGMDRMLAGLDPQKKGDQLYMDLAQTISIGVGKKDGNLLFMVIDPNCPHCKRAWKDMAPFIEKNGLQVRLIPIGILGDDSVRMAGMLMNGDSAANTAKWLEFAKADFDPAKLDGMPSEDAKAKVELNRAIFDRWQLKATPFIAYRSKAGGIKVLNAVPKDMEAVVKDVAPIPAKAPPLVIPAAPAQ